MKHGGTDHKKGVLHHGTKLQPSPVHGGSGLPKGRVHDAAKPHDKLARRGGGRPEAKIAIGSARVMDASPVWYRFYKTDDPLAPV